MIEIKIEMVADSDPDRYLIICGYTPLSDKPSCFPGGDFPMTLRSAIG